MKFLIAIGADYIYLYATGTLDMNYWEQRRSFWTTPAGVLLEIVAVVAILACALIALNIFSSPFPIIEHFKASPVTISPGETSTLSWSVIGATGVVIDQGIGRVELKGMRAVSPEETTIYTLSAVNGTRNVSSSAKVIVEA